MFGRSWKPTLSESVLLRAEFGGVDFDFDQGTVSNCISAMLQ